MESAPASPRFRAQPNRRGQREYVLTIREDDMNQYIDPAATPSSAGCIDCDRDGSWWVHLRRCAECGHVGCCDDSLNTHATAHFHETGHRIIQSFEPGEDWFWD